MAAIAGARPTLGTMALPPRVAALLLAALLLVACDKPGASHLTSPSAEALLGTVEGRVTYAQQLAAPEARPADGWDVRLENARFSKLEDGAASIQVALSVESQPGLSMEVWLSGPGGTALRWQGGQTRAYNGVVCFQLRLERDGAALQLAPGEYRMTVAFFEDGRPIVVADNRVAGQVPQLRGSPPGPASKVGKELLGCPRSVI